MNEVNEETMKCLECGEIFESHGNARYCPERNKIRNFCYMKAKLKRQKIRLKNEKKDIAEKERIIGYLEGILSRRLNAIIPKADFPMKFLGNKNFQKTVINRSVIYKIENFQIAKITNETEDKIQITKLNNQDEFSI